MKVVSVWDDKQWGGPATFYSINGKDKENSIVILHQNGEEHVHFHFHNKPSREDLNVLYDSISKNYKPGSILMTAGGASPGGIHGMNELSKHGFKIIGYVDENRCYWGGGIDKEKFSKWIKDPKNRKDFLIKKDKSGTYPKIPILKKL